MIPFVVAPGAKQYELARNTSHSTITKGGGNARGKVSLQQGRAMVHRVRKAKNSGRGAVVINVIRTRITLYIVERLLKSTDRKFSSRVHGFTKQKPSSECRFDCAFVGFGLC